MLKIFFLFLASCSDKESTDIRPRDIGFMDVNAHPFLLIFLYFQLISTNSEWHHTARNHISCRLCADGTVTMATRWATSRIKALGQKRQWQAALKILEVLQKWGGCGSVNLPGCAVGGCWPWKKWLPNENGKKKHEIKTSMIEHVIEADWGHYGTLMFSQFGWLVGVWVDKWQDMTEKKEAPTVHHFTAAMNACAATSMFYVKANFEMSAL